MMYDAFLNTLETAKEISVDDVPDQYVASCMKVFGVKQLHCVMQYHPKIATDAHVEKMFGVSLIISGEQLNGTHSGKHSGEDPV